MSNNIRDYSKEIKLRSDFLEHISDDRLKSIIRLVDIISEEMRGFLSCKKQKNKIGGESDG